MQDNTITDNVGYPICINMGGIKFPVLDYISNNIFARNINSGITYDGIALYGSLALDTTIKNNNKYINGGITVPGGRILTILEGVVIKSIVNTGISVSGKLIAVGNATTKQSVVFTTIKDPDYGGSGIPTTSDYWGGITVSSTGEFYGDVIKIKYGKSTNGSAVNVSGKLNLVNSEISFSGTYGIYYNSTIDPILAGLTFNKNNYGLYNAKYSTKNIFAQYCYWGTVEGPSTYNSLTGKWSGTGDKVSSGVIYGPWVGSEILKKFHFGAPGINTATGNFSRNYTDLNVPAPGFDITFTRTYNSSDEMQNGLFGKGWTFGYQGSIKDYSEKIKLPDGSIKEITNADFTGPDQKPKKVVKLPNGSELLFDFTVDASGNKTYKAVNSRNTLIEQGSYHILTTKDQVVYKFNPGGYLESITDRNGNSVTINVDSSGKVLSVTDQAGRVYSITYENGFIKSIRDYANRAVTYEYVNGNLVKVVDPTGSVTTYVYDAAGYLTEVKNHYSKRLESVVYDHREGENQHKVLNTTDANGNTFSYTYDNNFGKTTITDVNGKQTIKWHDDSYRITNTIYPDGKSTVIDYELYGDSKNMFGEEKSVTDRNGAKTQYVRDANNGNIITVINPDTSTNKKEFKYDSKNNLVSEKDENGKYTYYIYDTEMKNLAKRVQPLNGTDVYSATADQTKFAITTYTYYTEAERLQIGYKAKGLLKEVKDPENNVTKYEYDTNGYLSKVTDSENHTTTHVYDVIGRKKEEISPEGYKTQYYYDNNGRLEKQVLQGGETTRITYDAVGRKTLEVSPKLYDSSLEDALTKTYIGALGYRYTYHDSGKLKEAIDPNGKVTSYTYDLYGNIQTETKPSGAVYRYVYDDVNRLSKVYFKESASATEELLEEYAYAALAGAKSQKVHTKYLNNTETVVTVYIYDYAGRLLEQQNPEDSSKVVMVYNANGTLNTYTDARGSITYYKYDGLNRLTEQWMPFENVSGTVKYSYTAFEYDKAGKKVKEKYGKDKVSYNYIPTQFITKTYTYYKNGNLKSVVDNEGRKTEYQYDAGDNVIREDVYLDTLKKNTTEYINNYLGKPTVKKVHIMAGDIYVNDFNSNLPAQLVTTYFYDDNGNLEAVTTADGITTTYTYDNMDRQTGTSQEGQDEYGNPVTITTSTTYTWDGKVETSTDANGNVTRYHYNNRGLLVKVQDAQGGITAYYYDKAGRKTAEVSPKYYDPTKTLEQMNRTEYTYDRMDRVKTKVERYIDPISKLWVAVTTNAYTYDKNSNVTKEQDALGYELGYGTEYTYNLANKVVTVLDPVSKERLLAHTTKYDYDALGRKVSETNAVGAVTVYSYDDAGKVKSVTVKKSTSDPGQVIQTNIYDLAGNLLSQTDGNGNVTIYEYNALYKLRKATYPQDSTIPENIIKYQYDVMGNLRKQQDSMGGVDTYTYDNQGRMLSHTRGKQDGTESITTSVRYDKNGNSRFEVDGNGVVTENVYDSLDNLVETKVVVNGVEQKTIYGYDRNGNQTTVTDWRGNTYTNIYDALNRLIEKKDPYQKVIQKFEYNKNNAQIASYDAQGNQTRYEYDKNNRLLKTIDPENHTTSQTYDNVGKIEKKIDGNNNTTTYAYDEFNRLVKVTNAKAEVTSYTYDKNGNMLTQTDGKKNTTTLEYNAANKVIRRIDHNGRTGTAGSFTYMPAKTVSYTYYADGSLKTQTDRNGNTTNYTYDIHGRVLCKTTGDVTISYTYDNNGNQLTVTDSTGTTTRTYDDLNRVITKVVPGIGKTTFSYDIISGVEEGYVAETSKDPRDNLTIKVYDRVGRLYKVIADNKITTYNYYDNGNRQSVVYHDGLKEEYTYYKDNLVKTLTNTKADGTVIDTYSYTYDAAHNQVSKTDAKGATSYSYDVLNRLLKVTEPNGRVTDYTYDAAGNRLTETITEGTNKTVNTYTYNEQNRLTEIVTSVNSVIKEKTIYSYDNNGNQLTTARAQYISGAYQTPVVVVTNTYDKLNQLITTVSAGTTVVNTYNGEGYRVAKFVDGSLTKYLYEYDKVVLEVDEQGNQIAKNVYGTNLLARTVGNETYFYMYNGHADVTALITTIGEVAATYYYDAFGNIVEQTGSVNNNITYAGYQYDKETGLYYLNARMYDPKVARFLQEDTYYGDINDPLSLNLYTYCHNEPIMYDDPTGHKRKGVVISYNPNEYSLDVEVLQKSLRELGYKGKDGNSLKADGYFGDNTLYAVNNYKNAVGIENRVVRRDLIGDVVRDTYGKVGDTTWESLGLVLDDKYIMTADKSDLGHMTLVQGVTTRTTSTPVISTANTPISIDKGRHYGQLDELKAILMGTLKSIDTLRRVYIEESSSSYVGWVKRNAPFLVNESDFITEFKNGAMVNRPNEFGSRLATQIGFEVMTGNFVSAFATPSYSSTVSRYGVYNNGTSGLAKSNVMPQTGVERFDNLVVGTKKFDIWKSNLERRGYTVDLKELPSGNPANITNRGVVEIDPNQFRYVDMLHEKRHIFHNLVAESKTGRTVLNQKGSLKRDFAAIAEIDAYRYEVSLANKYGFSKEYTNYLKGMIGDYSSQWIRPNLTVNSFIDSLKYYNNK
ncbi:MAG: DUF6531 domain-containing protein [Clostridia bacterium]|nr:DUF6531 domain-containing protein [Clostridia bacterium]